MTEPSKRTALKFGFRRAGTQDYDATRSLVEQAFGIEGAETAAFLDALRADGCILGEWLAEEPDGPVGHIAFSRIWLQEPSGTRRHAALLTPLAIRPDRQCSGIGQQLMSQALGDLESQGETLFFVLGHPEYYPRAGFSAALAAEVESPWTGKPSFMARATAIPRGRLLLPRVIVDAH